MAMSEAPLSSHPIHPRTSPIIAELSYLTSSASMDEKEETRPDTSFHHPVCATDASGPSFHR